MTHLWLDTETYNEQPITKGTYAYAETVEVMLFQYAIDDGPVYVVDITNGEQIPWGVLTMLTDRSVILHAQNSNFDRTVMFLGQIIKHNPEGLKILHEPMRWRDSMIQAYAHSLKGSLDDLSMIFKLSEDEAKDKEGKQLIQLFCKPRPKTSKIRRATRLTHPVEWGRFKDYAKRDIVAMREVANKMPNWNYQEGGKELALWHLDQKINDRGIFIDVDLANKAITAIDNEQKRLAKQTQQLTDNEVQAASQRDAMLKHIIESYGITLPDMQASTLERRINDENIPEGLRELLAIRLQTSTTSTSKYKTLINRVSTDGRLRGTLQFMGAYRTGRWAGRGFQPQNLPRLTLPQWKIDQGIKALKMGAAELITDNIMRLTSNTIRGCICAPEGKKLVVSDLSNIEGRVLAWLAGEQWKINAFYDFDAGQGQDLYKLSYAKSFGVQAETVTKAQRQIGKVQELALGYEGGVGAFINFSLAYGIDLDEMADNAKNGIRPDILEQAKRAYLWARDNRRTYGLSEKAYIVCDAFKRSWREAHPKITEYWARLDKGVRAILAGHVESMPIGRVTIDRVNNWLRIQLPSGRYLCYPGARIDEKGKISYLGQNTYTRKWERINTYGGKIAENITQAVARDVLAWSMPEVEARGFEIVLTVHDEIISEAPDTTDFSVDLLSSILSAPPEWAEGLPLAAAGFESYRYKKD